MREDAVHHARIVDQGNDAHRPLAADANRLLSPTEMGELFKVLALGRRIERPLVGFARGNRSHAL